MSGDNMGAEQKPGRNNGIHVQGENSPVSPVAPIGAIIRSPEHTIIGPIDPPSGTQRGTLSPLDSEIAQSTRIDVQFREDLGLLRTLLTDGRSPDPKIDKKIKRYALFHGLPPQRQEELAVELSQVVGRLAEDNFDLYNLALRDTTQNVKEYRKRKQAYSSLEPGSAERIGLSRDVMVKAADTLNTKYSALLPEYSKLLMDSGLSEEETVQRLARFSDLAGNGTLIRLGHLAMLQREVSTAQIRAYPVYAGLMDRIAHTDGTMRIALMDDFDRAPFSERPKKAKRLIRRLDKILAEKARQVNGGLSELAEEIADSNYALNIRDRIKRATPLGVSGEKGLMMPSGIDRHVYQEKILASGLQTEVKYGPRTRAVDILDTLGVI